MAKSDLEEFPVVENNELESYPVESGGLDSFPVAERKRKGPGGVELLPMTDEDVKKGPASPAWQENYKRVQQAIAEGKVEDPRPSGTGNFLRAAGNAVGKGVTAFSRGGETLRDMLGEKMVGNNEKGEADPDTSKFIKKNRDEKYKDVNKEVDKALPYDPNLPSGKIGATGGGLVVPVAATLVGGPGAGAVVMGGQGAGGADEEVQALRESGKLTSEGKADAYVLGATAINTAMGLMGGKLGEAAGKKIIAEAGEQVGQAILKGDAAAVKVIMEKSGINITAGAVENIVGQAGNNALAQNAGSDRKISEGLVEAGLVGGTVTAAAGVKEVVGAARAPAVSKAKQVLDKILPVVETPVETPTPPSVKATDGGGKPWEALPPPEPGTVRMFHGGPTGASSGEAIDTRWVSPDPVYARDYRGGGDKDLYYVDVPQDSPLLRKAFDDEGADQKAPYVNVDLPADIAKNLKPVVARTVENVPGLGPANINDAAFAKKGDENVTSIKNKEVDIELAMRGEPGWQKVEPQERSKVWTEVKADLTADPDAGRKLVTELEANPRPTTTKETLTLLARKVEARKDWNDVHEELVRAEKSNDVDGVFAANVAKDRLWNELNVIDKVTKQVGTEAGRALAARAEMADTKYDLVRMVREAEEVTGGKLNEKQLKEVETIGRQVEELETQIIQKEDPTPAKPTEEDVTNNLRYAETALKDLDTVKPESKEAEKQGVTPTEPEAQLKQIEELKDPELKPVVEELKKEIEAREAEGTLIEQISEVTKRTTSGDATPTQKDSLNELKKELVDQLKVLRNRKDNTWETAIEIKKARYRQQIAELKEKIEKQDFAPKRKPGEVTHDPEAQALRIKRDKLVDKFSEKKKFWEFQNQPATKQAVSFLGKLGNEARTLKTSFDLSAVFNQGGWLGAAHPVIASKAAKQMLRSVKNEDVARIVYDEIVHRPNAPLYAQSKLRIVRTGGDLTAREEAYQGNLLKRAPVLGKAIRASENAYTTDLNVLRADAFDAMFGEIAKRDRAPSMEEVNAIANYINIATGFGDLGKFSQAAELLNTTFFAPRNLVSRFQLLTLQPVRKAPASVRGLILKEYAKSLTGIGTFVALGLAAGAGFEYDPRSSDFGKLKFGDTRIDPFVGLSQITTFTARVGTGVEKSPNSGLFTDLRGEDSRAKDIAKVGWNFLRSKFAPTITTALDTASIGNKDFKGEVITPKSVAINAVAPMGFEDLYKTMKAQDVPTGTALALLGFLGMRLSTYEKATKELIIDELRKNPRDASRVLGERVKKGDIDRREATGLFKESRMTQEERQLHVSSPKKAVEILENMEPAARKHAKTMVYQKIAGSSLTIEEKKALVKKVGELR